jgi:hypothetical protein
LCEFNHSILHPYPSEPEDRLIPFKMSEDLEEDEPFVSLGVDELVVAEEK